MKITPFRAFSFIILSSFVLAFLLYQVSADHLRVQWHLLVWGTCISGFFNPAGDLTTPICDDEVFLSTSELMRMTRILFSPMDDLETAATTAAAPVPPIVMQDNHNCGPATLTILLSCWGWEGAQQAVSRVIKPIDKDRSVNPDELVRFVQSEIPWPHILCRSGSDLLLIKRLRGADLSVLLETGAVLDHGYWSGDDLWAGHYLLLTGYNDRDTVFITQDSWKGGNRTLSYERLLDQWQVINFIFY